MPSRSKGHRGKIIGIIIVLLLLIMVGGFLFFVNYSISATGDGTTQKVITVTDNESFDDVLNDLQDENLIHSASVAKLYTKIDKDVAYYAGNYTLNDGMSLSEIFDYLSDPLNAKADQITLTVPEGKWAKEIAQLISDTFGYSKDDIIAQWNDSTYLKTLCEDYEFLNYKSINKKSYRVKLEGYLYPETYSLDPDASIDDITRTMLDQFNAMYQSKKDQFEKSDLSVHQIVTLASIVQFESSNKSNMKKIASVFYNRLNNDMALGSSVTVCYALYDDFNDPQDCETQTDIESPYNTYLNKGLPVGPILNPGADAFDATLNPDDTNYLYFLADINGDGTVYFFENYEDHQAKQEELGLVY